MKPRIAILSALPLVFLIIAGRQPLAAATGSFRSEHAARPLPVLGARRSGRVGGAAFGSPRGCWDGPRPGRPPPPRLMAATSYSTPGATARRGRWKSSTRRRLAGWPGHRHRRRRHDHHRRLYQAGFQRKPNPTAYSLLSRPGWPVGRTPHPRAVDCSYPVLALALDNDGRPRVLTTGSTADQRPLLIYAYALPQGWLNHPLPSNATRLAPSRWRSTAITSLSSYMRPTTRSTTVLASAKSFTWPGAARRAGQTSPSPRAS